MAIEDYFASTARNSKDIAQYFVYPVAKILGLITFKESNKANIAAGVVTSAFYGLLAETFLDREMDGFDRIAREAVAAELGKKPEDLKFSDYLRSQNDVVKCRIKLLKEENVLRYTVAAAPMLPTAMELLARKTNPGGKMKQPDQGDIDSGETRVRHERPSAKGSWKEQVLHGWNLWDGSVYGAIAMLWLYETYGVKKTFAYQGRKEMENNESLGLKIGPNNIMGLYNRMREDRKLEVVNSKTDREKLWPMFEQLSEKVNHSDRFGLAELTYLMGLRKLDVFKTDAAGQEVRDGDNHLIIDEAKYRQALAEIEKVSTVGLEGIGREQAQLAVHKPKVQLGLVDRMVGSWFNAHFNGYKAVAGRRKHFIENISPRDPSENPMSL